MGRRKLLGTPVVLNTFDGPWQIGITESGVSAAVDFGGSPQGQVDSINPLTTAYRTHAGDLAFASLIFAVHPVDLSTIIPDPMGTGAAAINWAKGLSMYDHDPVESTITPRPVHAEILQTID